MSSTFCRQRKKSPEKDLSGKLRPYEDLPHLVVFSWVEVDPRFRGVQKKGEVVTGS